MAQRSDPAKSQSLSLGNLRLPYGLKFIEIDEQRLRAPGSREGYLEAEFKRLGNPKDEQAYART